MSSARRPRPTWIAGSVVLVTVWLLLWEDLSWANVLSGTVLAVAVLALVNRPIDEGADRIRILASLRLIVWFAWQLVVASTVVAWEVLTPTQHVRQGIVEVDLRTASPRVATLVANITSLIPGTLTLEVMPDPMRLYVHVLHLRDPDGVRADTARLEELVVRAVAASMLPLDPYAPRRAQPEEPTHSEKGNRS